MGTRWSLIWAMFLLVLAPVSGTAGSEPAAVDPVEQAAAALDQGNLRQAVGHFRAAVALRPDDPGVHRNLALAYYDLRLLDESVTAMREAVRLAPQESLFHMELGALLLAADDFSAAETELATALERNPGLGEAYWYLGRLYLETGRPRMAARALGRAARLGVPVDWLRERLPASATPSAAGEGAVSSADSIVLRMLPVQSVEAGRQLLAAIEAGEILFEFAGGRPEVAGPVVNGGYAGSFTAAELDPAVRAAVVSLTPFAPPVLVETPEQVLLVQRISTFDPERWREQEVAPPDRAVADDDLVRTSSDSTKRRVYAGAFGQRQRALALVRRLRERGFSAYCLYDDRKAFPYIVVAGEYPDLAGAQKAVVRLVALGYKDAFISRRQ